MNAPNRSENMVLIENEFGNEIRELIEKENNENNRNLVVKIPGERFFREEPNYCKWVTGSNYGQCTVLI